MNILHLSFSPRGQAAESYKLSRKIVEALLAQHPSATLTSRLMGDGALPHIDANYAHAQYPSAAPTPPEGSIVRSEALIQELESADVVVIGTPMHNWTVPSALKAWIDHIVRARRTFHGTADGKVGDLRDRPVFIGVASGAKFSGESARQPDFLTPYLRYALGIIGLHDLTFFTLEGTASPAQSVAEAWAKAEGALQEHFSPAALAMT